jgi:peroxiredoxin
VRLELAHLDLQGRLAVDSAASALCPLEGPPTLECGPFVEAPRGRIGVEKPWEAREEGRPNRTWRLTGFENAGGINCLKLVGVQQSDDWDQPHGNRTAWRRTDTVWLLPRFGVAQKLERVIERRAPARQEVTQRSVLSYELETGLQYPGQLGEDRRKEILAARKFAEDLAPYQSAPGRYPAQLEGLATKIAHHLDNLPPTPYREAVLAVQRRAAAARRGESPPAPLIEDNDAAPAVIQVGRLAPDFVLGDFAGKETVRRRSWLGKPVLMVFYNPASATAAELLRFAQATADAHKDAVVVGLPLTENAEVVDRQRGALKLTIPLLRGGGLRQSYDVEATPKLVVLDAQGVVCGAFVGWGNETMEAVQVEVKHALEGRR